MFLDGVAHSEVQGFARRPEECLIGHLLGEGVLEDVLDLWQTRPFMQEIGAFQAGLHGSTYARQSKIHGLRVSSLFQG